MPIHVSDHNIKPVLLYCLDMWVFLTPRFKSRAWRQSSSSSRKECTILH